MRVDRYWRERGIDVYDIPDNRATADRRKHRSSEWSSGTGCDHRSRSAVRDLGAARRNSRRDVPNVRLPVAESGRAVRACRCRGHCLLADDCHPMVEHPARPAGLGHSHDRHHGVGRDVAIAIRHPGRRAVRPSVSANSPRGGLQFLAATPLLWLSLTLGAYLAAVVVNERCNKTPLLNPTLLAIAIVVAVLAATGTSYKRYFDGAQFVHFLLGPAVVAMAVPLYRHTEIIRKSTSALLGALGIGSVTAILSSVLLARGLGGGRELWLSMAPKSATAAISMAISGRIGGVPALTAVLTISTGITGACLAGYVLRFVGVKEWHARGFAMGLASHGIATARAFQENEVVGTFAGLAMALNGIATAALVPLILQLLDRGLPAK